jgi:UDP-glucose 4-epimerase
LLSLAELLVGLAELLAGLVELLAGLAGRGRVKIYPYPDERRGIEIGDYYAGQGKFRELTGWQPRVRLRDGLKLALEYFVPRLAPHV